MMGGAELTTGRPEWTVEVLDLKKKTWQYAEPLLAASSLHATLPVPREWFKSAAPKPLG